MRSFERCTKRLASARTAAFIRKWNMKRPMHVSSVWAVACTTARNSDMTHMRTAIHEAAIASQEGEVPVGAVIAKDGQEICRAHNRTEQTKDATAHAEMQCLRKASKLLGAWRLEGCTLYVTLEPCPMCAGAILQARVDRVVYGARNSLLGADGSWIQMFPRPVTSSGEFDQAHAKQNKLRQNELRHPFHVSMQVEAGVASEQCADLMKTFFRKRRAQSRLVKYTQTCWSRLCDA